MKLILNNINETMQYCLSTINYGRTDIIFDLNIIEIEDGKNNNCPLIINQPIELPDYNNFDGIIDLTITGYNDYYTFGFDLNVPFRISVDKIAFASYLKHDLTKPSHIGIDLLKNLIKSNEDAYEDLCESLSAEVDTIIEKLNETLNTMIEIEG